jgi:enamine deaminase RidA (YjgF/YER057c/UK114 family)
MKHRRKVALVAIAAVALVAIVAAPNVVSKPVKSLVTYVDPPNVPPPINGTWSQVAATKDMVFVAGQRGRLLDGTLVPLDDDGSNRIRQAYRNMKNAAESQGTSLNNTVRMVVYSTDIRYRAIANAIQNEPEFWGTRPKPPRTFVVVSELAENDIFEVEGTFARSSKGHGHHR